MAPSIATVKIARDMVLPLRIFVNRKQLLQSNEKTGNKSNATIFEAPLLSNNSIVCLKSPNTRIYLSQQDKKNLCDEIKEDLLLIVYELASPEIISSVLSKIRIGHSIDFQTKVFPKLFAGADTDDVVTSHIRTVTRLAKFKYKLEYKHKWELDIFINSIKKIANLRHYLIFQTLTLNGFSLNAGPKTLLAMKIEKQPQVPNLLTENEEADALVTPIEEDIKPVIEFMYKPVINLGEIIDIHVLHRPRRHKICTQSNQPQEE
ncbi:DNA-binding protein SAW1 [Saccharomyces paradoxus]|uniref:DNA-binding protein SAW1 n=1 Tax=Saccharomyces paradoxus TaxID=27291 RepID=A0A8B8ULD3_SACPA|nr:Saw1 [Saccharomyces paradoxus]QHS71414.1 Saw1 [Saccharomyces paradoxus]